MDNRPAFSYDQIQRYTAKRQRTLAIDNPGAAVAFVTAADAGTVREGQAGVIQVDVPGRASVHTERFVCCYTAALHKTFWRPAGPDAPRTYDAFALLGLEPS